MTPWDDSPLDRWMKWLFPVVNGLVLAPLIGWASMSLCFAITAIMKGDNPGFSMLFSFLFSGFLLGSLPYTLAAACLIAGLSRLWLRGKPRHVRAVGGLLMGVAAAVAFPFWLAVRFDISTTDATLAVFALPVLLTGALSGLLQGLATDAEESVASQEKRS